MRINPNSLKNLTYRIPKGNIPWNKGTKGKVLSPYRDITGKKFGRLTAVRLYERKERPNGNYRYYWLFKCDCGKETITDRSSVTIVQTTSCGCRLQELHNTARYRFKTHGMSYTRFHLIYTHIVARCKNSRIKNYGGRGIKCLWKTFEDFRDDMHESYLAHSVEHGEKNTSIDRIDVNGNYHKENCRWATPLEQGRNKRNSALIEFDGNTKCLSEWSEITGIKAETIKSRIDILGWPIDKALTTPVR